MNADASVPRPAIAPPTGRRHRGGFAPPAMKPPPLPRVLLALISLGALMPAARADKPDWPGIWAMWGGENIRAVERPWIKGCLGTTTWSTIEPRRGEFDFTEMDRFIRTAAGNGLYVGYMIYVGPSSPDWVYQTGVPRVLVEGKPFPHYLHPDYRTLLKTMIRRVAGHVQSYPPELRQRLAFLQCPAGTSGDPQPWDAPPDDPRYAIDRKSAEWQAYNREIFEAYVAAYRHAEPPVSLLMKPDEENFRALSASVPNLFVKTYTVAQGYQTRDDLKWDWLRQAISQFQPDGRAVRARGEFTHIDLKTSGWFREAPVWNVYTQCLWALAYGLDVLNLREPHLIGHDSARHERAFRFFTAYAGYKAADDSHGAWCALRDGLDYDDRERFPEAQFGALSDGRNLARYEKIAAAFAGRGARMGETDLCWADGVTWTKRAARINDVCRRPWPGNYGMFLTQLHPGETSVGHWRVGSLDEPYGRFARGFEHATGRDRMSFDVSDAFFGGAPLAGRHAVTVRVVYFDQGRGTWSLRYDAAGEPDKTALAVTKTDSGKWKEVTVELTDAHLGNRGPQRGDLALVNTDAEDDIFHLIEITRANGDRKGHWGYRK